jgi:uncharacterized surface protein with fasciclin (FAS1) repeats
MAERPNFHTKEIRMRLKAIGAAVILAAVALTGCSSDTDEAAPATTTPAATTNNIVVVAQNTPDLSTLVQAVVAAELVETLQGTGPYTVLAPTNAAFAAIPADTLAALLAPANRATLQKILTYHVIQGNVKSGDVKAGPVKTVEGSDVTFAVNGTDITVAGSTQPPAKVVLPDVTASNGTVHVIDGVLIPPTVDLSTLVPATAPATP